MPPKDNNIDNGKLSENFYVAPNPVNRTADNIFFLFTGNKRSTAELIIYDAIGNIVYKNTYNLRVSNNNGKPLYAERIFQ